MSENNNIKKEFFAAANSGKGFVSFYDRIFKGDNIKRRYLIKGGPGTGKSTFMKALAEAAEKENMSVERYRCSSDPMSLDGVIINDCVAIIDSTAPHAEEAELCGARDIIVDLGAFWNSNGLYEAKERIENLTGKKKKAYSLAYKFLSAAMQSDVASREFVISYVDSRRLVKLAKRLTRDISSDGAHECKIGILNSIGMKGRYRLDTYASLSQKIVYIEEHYGIGYLAICEICEQARKKGCKICVSYDPLLPDYPDAVFFEKSKTLFILCEPRKRGAVSLRRALDISVFSKAQKNELRAKSRNAKKISNALILAATDELKSAGDAHFELEKIYRENMDFSSLNAYTTQLIKQIIDFCRVNN